MCVHSGVVQRSKHELPGTSMVFGVGDLIRFCLIGSDWVGINLYDVCAVGGGLVGCCSGRAAPLHCCTPSLYGKLCERTCVVNKRWGVGRSAMALAKTPTAPIRSVFRTASQTTAAVSHHPDCPDNPDLLVSERCASVVPIPSVGVVAAPLAAQLTCGSLVMF